MSDARRAIREEQSTRRMLDRESRAVRSVQRQQADRAAGTYWAHRERGRRARQPVRIEVDPTGVGGVPPMCDSKGRHGRRSRRSADRQRRNEELQRRATRLSTRRAPASRGVLARRRRTRCLALFTRSPPDWRQSATPPRCSRRTRRDLACEQNPTTVTKPAMIDG